MPLRYDTTKCKPSSTPQNGKEETVRGILMMLTMRIGMNEITEKNWMDFYARIKMLEKTNAALMYLPREKPDSKPTPYYLKPEDIYRWVGMHTNASTTTELQFLKSLKYDLQDSRRECRLWKEGNGKK